MPIPQIKSTLKNARTATLDLDNLYSAPAPRDPAAPDKMALGRVS